MFLANPNYPMYFTIEDVFTPEECASWVQKIQEMGPTDAPITTASGPVMASSTRNNRRVMFDDVNATKDLFERIKDRLPPDFMGFRLHGLNERLRCYEYHPKQYFRPHMDGCFQRDDDERSFYTLMVYLNEGCEGGETTFFLDPEVKIIPKTGMVLCFQHPIYHEGSEVTAGVKYVLRTDVMYRRKPRR